LDLPPGGLLALQNAAAAAAASSASPTSAVPPPIGGTSTGSGISSLDFLRRMSSAAQAAQSSDDAGTPSTTGSGNGIHSAFSAVGNVLRQHSRLSDSQDSQGFECGRLPPSSGSLGAKSIESRLSDDHPSASAVLLRRRFSSQRHTNLSTSSSGTNGTGCINTGCSSTDSSMDASSFYHVTDSRRPATASTNLSPLPRFAISPCGEQRVPSTTRRATVSDERDLSEKIATERHYQSGTYSSTAGDHLSPVEELRPSAMPTNEYSKERIATAEDGRHGRQTRSASCKSDSLRVLIPSAVGGASTSSSPSSNQHHHAGGTTTYYHSYGPTGAGQLSPGCNSISSASSFDSGNSPNPSLNASTSTVVGPVGRHSIAAIGGGNSPSQLRQPNSASKPPIVIRKGPQGYGFTIRSVRVYLSENSEYYTIEHIVAAVRENSPAYEAGLRENDLVTHIHTQAVHNMTHPQLMHRLLSCGNEITLHVTPLQNTSIKEGEARRNVGKLLRKKPKRPHRRAPLEKKQRKSSALLRRLSGKRAGEIVPGTSSQKQTFMPRSASSQEGVASLNIHAAPKSQLLLSAESAATSKSVVSSSASGTQSSLSVSLRHKMGGEKPLPPTHKQKRLSDFGITSTSPIPEVPQSRSGRTSPLVFSSKGHSRTEAEQPPPLPPHRRPSLLQGLLHPNSQSHNIPTSSSSRKNSAGASPMPVSPLARQSSTSGTVTTTTTTKSTKPIASVTVDSNPPALKISQKSPPRPPPPKLSPAQKESAANNITARSPSPVRKISPSRLVQRFFRGASKETSGSNSTGNTQ
jgi:hypothetical protein